MTDLQALYRQFELFFSLQCQFATIKLTPNKKK